MRILYIHNQKRIRTGAHQVNDMFVTELKKRGLRVDTIYPPGQYQSTIRGINSILFFHTLIQKKKESYKYDVIQGTTYTVLAFLESGAPTVSHFGSTTYGFIKSVPSLKGLEKENKDFSKIYRELKDRGILSVLNPKITRSLKNVSDIEVEVAQKCSAVVASSEGVKNELVKNKVPSEKISVIHNAIENFWFENPPVKNTKGRAELVYLGRMGDDPFTIKLKGINRLVWVWRRFPDLKKLTIGMSGKKENEFSKLFQEIPNTRALMNVRKRIIPKILNHHYGDIYVNPGRYEGFCLSLIEAMSQGLVPVIFPIGVAPEIIKNGKNGYLVNSVEEMEEKIKFLAGKRHLRAKMAEAALETSVMFMPEKIIPRFIEFYEKLHRENAYGGLMSFVENFSGRQ